MRTYTEIELLNLYRDHLGLCRVLVLPAENERQPVDRELLSTLTARYNRLLATEDVCLLPVEDVADPSLATFSDDGTAMQIRLPDRCLRPVSLCVHGWAIPLFDFLPAGSPLHRRQSRPALRASCRNPLCFRSASTLYVYGLPEVDGKFLSFSLRAVVKPADGTFRFDDSLLPKLLNP